MSKPDASPSDPSVIVVPLAALLMAIWGLATLPCAPHDSASTVPSDPTRELANAATEPSAGLIHGRTLEEWRELMNSLDHDDSTRADYVPALIEIVRSSEVPWFSRRQAALTLGRWGPAATTAIPVLEALLDEPKVEAEEATVFWALKGLSLFGPEARAAVPKISEIASDSRRPDGQRLAAMECLSQIGTANPSGLLSLLQIAQASAVPSEPSNIRRGSIEAIGLFRGGASAAVPILVRALDDPDVEIRREAATALGRQGPGAEIAQNSLLERFVSDDDAIVRDAAGIALAQTGRVAIPVLISFLEQQDDEDLRLRSAVVLGKWGRDANSAAPALKALWEDPQAAVRLAALDAYWKVTQQGEVVAPNVARALSSPNRNIRRQAYLLLMALGSSAVAARPVLEEQIQSPRPDVRSTARKLLKLQDNMNK